MTRKDFELIASVIRSMDSESNSRIAIAEAFADALWQINPRYARTRFLVACEPKNKV